LTLRDVVVHDCPARGIFSAWDSNGSLTIESSEVYHCGSGATDHQVYVAIDETVFPDGVFRMQHSYVHDATGGNNVMSRSPAPSSTTTASKAPTTTRSS